MKWEQLRALREAIPASNCKGLCGEGVCDKPAPCRPEELEILVSIGKPPREGPAGRCGYLLNDGRCDVYSERPVSCRIYGQEPLESEELGYPVWHCPFGCNRTRRAEQFELERALSAAGYFQGQPLVSTSPGMNKILQEMRSEKPGTPCDLLEIEFDGQNWKRVRARQ